MRIQQARGTSDSLAANGQTKLLTPQLEVERQLAQLSQNKAFGEQRSQSEARQAEADRVAKEFLDRQRADFAHQQALVDVEARGKILQQGCDQCLLQAASSGTPEVRPAANLLPKPDLHALLLEMQSALALERQENGMLHDDLVVQQNLSNKANALLAELKVSAPSPAPMPVLVSSISAAPSTLGASSFTYSQHATPFQPVGTPLPVPPAQVFALD